MKNLSYFTVVAPLCSKIPEVWSGLCRSCSLPKYNKSGLFPFYISTTDSTSLSMKTIKLLRNIHHIQLILELDYRGSDSFFARKFLEQNHTLNKKNGRNTTTPPTMCLENCACRSSK
jgi:hypothetical protein